MLERFSGYPRLSNPTSIHVTPRDGFVQTWTRLPQPGMMKSFKLDDLLKGGWVNRTGVSVLQRCTGIESAEEILGRTRTDDGLHIGSEAFWSFLMAAQQRKFVEFLDAPSEPALICKSGSSDAFWPLHASIELTNQCNLRCLHCYADATPSPREELPTAELLNILEEWSAYGLAGVELTGGEPLLHPDFMEIFEACLEQFFKIAILTNGTLVDDAFVRKVRDSGGRVSISISLDGSTAEQHDAVRGPGTFEKTTRAIRQLSEAGCSVYASMVAAPYNIDDVKRTGELAERLGVRKFGVAPVMPFGRGEPYASQLTQNDWSTISTAMEELPRVACLRDATFDTRLQQMGNCGVGITNMMLTPHGRLKACLFLKEEECFGDLKVQKVEEVLNSPRLQALSELRAPGGDSCSTCAYEAFCYGCVVRGMRIVAKHQQLCRWAKENELSRVFPSYATYSFHDSEAVFRADRCLPVC